MNSKQRRQDRRAWKHVVMFDHDSVDWEKYHQVWNWTANTFGTKLDKWRESHNCIGTHWQFKREREALVFRLKWGGDYELRNNQIR